MPAKSWGSRGRLQANAPVPHIPSPKLVEMVEQVRRGTADVARSRENIQQHMATMVQHIVKLDEQARLARDAHREDLALEALTRKQELKHKLTELGKANERLENDELELKRRLKLLEERVAALKRQGTEILRQDGRQLDPDSGSFGLGAPLGERNSRLIPQAVKIAVAARDGAMCRQCGSTDDLHFDHVIPWSKGGANTVNNIQLLCGPCNRRKGTDDIPASW